MDDEKKILVVVPSAREIKEVLHHFSIFQKKGFIVNVFPASFLPDYTVGKQADVVIVSPRVDKKFHPYFKQCSYPYGKFLIAEPLDVKYIEENPSYRNSSSRYIFLQRKKEIE